MAVLFRINAQSESFEEALTARGLSYVVRGRRAVLRAPGGAAGAGPDAWPAARGSRGHRRARRPGGRSAQRHGLVRRRRRPPEVRRVTGGSRCRRWSPRQPSMSPARRPPAGLRHWPGSWPSSTVVPTSSTPRSPRASPWRPCTRPRASSGTRCSCAAMQEGSMPITYADTPAAVEEERRLLYVGVTRARVHLWISWALARNPGGQARRRPSRFLAGLRPESATDRADAAGPARGARKRGKKAAVCKQCQKPLASSRERNRGYCQDCPVPYDEELFELLRSWRKETGRGAERSGVRGVLRRDARGARRGQAEGPPGSAVHQRHRQGQARQVRRRRCSESSAEHSRTSAVSRGKITTSKRSE